MSSDRSRSTSAEDAALVARVAAGDQEALQDLHLRFGGLLVALSQRVLRRREDAEDVVQEVFLQVWRQAGRYDRRRSSVSTWLVMITRSRSIDRLRSRGVGERVVETMMDQKMVPTHASASGVESVLHGERRSRLRALLAELPTEQREVLELAYFQGLTQREISEQTGTPLGTVKTRTLLAMKKLRSALEEEIGELL